MAALVLLAAFSYQLKMDCIDFSVLTRFNP